MKASCPRCHARSDATPGLLLTCRNCGFSDIVPGPATAQPRAPTARGPATQASPAPTVSMGLAVAALLLNVLLLPGLGSVIAGRTEAGIWQLVLGLGAGLLALILIFTIVGILLIPLVLLAPIAAWIWGLITGIQLVQEAQ